ncbi:MAG: acetyl-CoA C-acetyltransferase [Oscillospiraceae bacterium]|nr:acetyl-CoA C-acetyltransferase [Oscillospiraceae bacterium]
MKEVYLISSCRTAVGSFGGSLKDVPAAKLGAIVAKEALRRANLTGAELDEVMFGCVLTAGLGQNVARQAAIYAGIPYEVPAYTVGMVCGSGMKSIVEAARAIKAGDADIVLAGGTENMSAAPYALPSARFGARMNNTTMVDTMVNDALWDIYHNYHMGITAENVCDQWGITREELDEFSLRSQERALAAIAAGKFEDEIVPVEIKQKKQTVEFKVDEYPRQTSMELLGKLKPAFKADGKVTAGNASGINDGAAAVILASGEAVEKYGLKPLFRLVSWGQGGVDPAIMGVAPIVASRNALAKAGMKVEDMDLVEANEAFAAQCIAVARELGLDMEKTNVNGGAIAIGHPVGASGTRITVTLLHEMMRRKEAKYGLATLCIGGGNAVATIWEKL